MLIAGRATFAWIGLVLDHAVPDIWPSSHPKEWSGRDNAQAAGLRIVLAGTGFSLLGMALARRFRHGVVTALFGTGAALSLLVGLWMCAVVTPDAPERPVERVPRCMEHSGEPTTCPGG